MSTAEKIIDQLRRRANLHSSSAGGTGGSLSSSKSSVLLQLLNDRSHHGEGADGADPSDGEGGLDPAEFTQEKASHLDDQIQSCKNEVVELLAHVRAMKLIYGETASRHYNVLNEKYVTQLKDTLAAIKNEFENTPLPPPSPHPAKPGKAGRRPKGADRSDHGDHDRWCYTVPVANQYDLLRNNDD